MNSDSKQLLIVVRTYPTPSAKDIEVSCTAAVTLNAEWIRLYPVRYRYLPKDKQFHKYDLIEVRLKKASEHRGESFNLDPDSIRIVSHVSTAKNWTERKKIILRAKSPSLCFLQTHLDNDPRAPTLGIFKPAQIERLIIEPEDPNWTPDQLAKLKQHEQGQLFGTTPNIPELQKIPYKFSYKFKCDDSACRTHTLMCSDWEMGEAYRRWRLDYGANRWEEMFREKFERQMIEKFDTHFYVGTVAQHPKTWIIVGLFYPPRSKA